MHVEQRVKWRINTTAVAVTLFLAACRAGPGATNAGNATTPTVDVTPTNPSTPGSALQVAVISAAERYAASGSIALTVRNDSGQTVYAEAHFTDCSIIALERFSAGAWQPVAACADGFPHPYVERIPPGTAVAIQLAPMSGSSGAAESTPPIWPAGTYRAELTYTTSATADFAQGMVIDSTAFSIG